MPLLTELGNKATPIYKHCAPPERGNGNLVRYQRLKQMADATNTTRFRLWLWLIRLIGVIVPRRFRAGWRQEWEAELLYRETLLAEWERLDWQTKLALLWHSLGAFADALWLQPKRWEDEMIQDLRYGVRMLLKSPVFTFAAILSLAIGIGANTALFSVVNAVLWRPLPYPHAERLVHLGYLRWPAEFMAISEANRVFDGLAAWQNSDFILTGHGEPVRLLGQRITPGLLSLLGVTPQAGRAFAAEEFQAGRDQVVIISDRLWRDRFGADPKIIGQAVTLDERSYTIIGVAPPRFDFFPSSDLLTPKAFTSPGLSRDEFDMAFVARLKPGVTPERAQQELAMIVGRARQPQPLRKLLVEDFRLTLLAVWCVVGFVLLIACANLANLMLARAANRQKELAVRAAIGARRLRLMRQLLTESVLVALLGGALGLFFAYFGVKALSAANPVIIPLSSDPNLSFNDSVTAHFGYGISYLRGSSGMESIPRLGEVAIDGEVLVFTFVLALITGTLFGLAPALQFSRPDLSHALKDGAAVSGVGFRFRRRRRTQSLLVIGEVALALVLLAGAGLLIRSIWRLHEERLGFQPEKLLTMQLQFPSFKYRNEAKVASFLTQISERLAALPGVESAGAANSLPLSKLGGFASLRIEGQPEWLPPKEKPKERPKDVPVAFFSKISPNYIRTMGIPLRQGREFDAHDNRQSLPVVIINEEMARRYWPGENPVGKRLKLAVQVPWMTVVGVAGNIKRFAMEDQTLPEFYVPMLQHADNSGEMDMFGLGTFVAVRLSGRPADLAEAVRQTVWSLDRDLPIQRIVAMEDRVAEVFAPRRFHMLVFGLFALIALLLAALGIYGVIAYSVAQRTHEIGIRMALGATSRDVLLLVVRQGMILTLIGVAVGLVAALALTRVLRNLLFGVSATDPATFIGIALLLTGVALTASYIPARRATKVDPLVALRHE
jgi:ABC-type lipoprotein release transport system permease subunit